MIATKSWQSVAMLGALRPGFAKFYTERSFGGWSFFTDCASFIATQDQFGLSEGHDERWTPKKANACLQYAGEPEGDTITVQTSVLREWAGPVPEPTPKTCQSCKGDGKATHYCDCEYCNREKSGRPCYECDGSGEVEFYEVRNGKINGLLIDVDRVSAMAYAVPDESVRVRIAKDRLWIFGNNWKAAIMHLTVGETSVPELKL